MGAELANKRLGIFGYGNIGRIVASRAKGLGMQVAAYDPFVNEEVFTADGVSCVELDELVRISDFFSFHCLKNSCSGIFFCPNSSITSGTHYVSFFIYNSTI